MDSSSKKIPAHEAIYQRIHNKILFGDLAPGQAVTIQGLGKELGVSMTPIREAIRRLCAEGALETLGNRRIVVPEIDADRFREITIARLAIEPKLAEIAAKNMLMQDVDNLRSVDDALNLAIEKGDAKSYMRENHRFHFDLYQYAESSILLPIAETLWLRFGPLYRIISGKYGTGNLIDHHDEAIAALRAGEAQSVGNAVAFDIEQGFEIVRRNFGWG